MDSVATTFARIVGWEPSRRLHRFLMPTLFVVGFVAHMARRRGVLSNPTLFAEDGQIFMLGSLRDGFRGLNDVYNGYLIVGTRCLALLSTIFPLGWTPSTYAVLAGLVSVGSCAVATRSQLVWAFGGWIPRALVFLALVMLPQVSETHATLTNATWWAGIGLLLVGLADEPVTWWGRVSELVFVVVVTLTGPIGIVLFPIVLWRLWRIRLPWTLALGVMWGAAGLLQLMILRGQDRKVETLDWNTNLFGVLLRRWLGPFTAGSDYVQAHLAGPPWSRPAWLLVVLFGCGLVVVALRARDRGAGIVLLGLASLQIVAGFVALGPLAPLLPDRYALGAIAAVVMLVAVARPHRWPVRVVQIALIVGMLIGWPRNISVPERPARPFTEAAKCLELPDTTCRVPAEPDAFSFVVTPNDR